MDVYDFARLADAIETAVMDADEELSVTALNNVMDAIAKAAGYNTTT